MRRQCERMSCVQVLRAALVGMFLSGTAVAENGQSDAVYAIFPIHQIGPTALATLKARVGHQLAIEADDELILLTTKKQVESSGFKPTYLSVQPDPARLFVVRKIHQESVMQLEGALIAEAGRAVVLQADSSYLPQLTWHPAVKPLKESIVLARQVANEVLPEFNAFSQTTDSIVEQINGQRWMNDVVHLAGINRYTRGTTIQVAQKFLEESLAALPGMEVSTQEFSMGATTAWNVIGRLSGTKRPDEWIIVSAHYDSTSQSPTSAAPGAEDNASGAAGMLELARVFAANPPEATILFIGFSGEEQGLKGSYAHVAKIIADGHKSKIKAVLNMDMIGYTSDSDLDCLLESDRLGSSLFPIMTGAATRYTSLRMVTSLNPFGSDHMPYIERGIPAMLVIENDWNQYPNYHKTTDTVDRLTQAMGEQILRMQAGAVAELSVLP